MSGTQTAPADQDSRSAKSPLSIEDVVAVARYGTTVRIADTATRRDAGSSSRC